MKFFDDFTSQFNKDGMTVCGDHTLCARKPFGTFYVLCDGVGSGVYANISAIACSARLMQMLTDGISPRAACGTVAASMHRARREKIPFCAFTCAAVAPDGQYFAYNYEAPEPVLLRGGTAALMQPNFYEAGGEQYGECTGGLELGDGLLLFSDGVSQAGLGGRRLGLGNAGVAQRANEWLQQDTPIYKLPEKVTALCAEISGGRYEDDTTAALLRCRAAEPLVILTGPPTKKSMDAEVVDRFLAAPGRHVICGSTTADIVSRRTGRPVELSRGPASPGSAPEYEMEGIDMTTEGAIMLSQVGNIILEPEESYVEDSPAERLATLMKDADVITFMNGAVVNDAHQALLFKEVGVHPRERAVRELAEKLAALGKLVEIEKY